MNHDRRPPPDARRLPVYVYLFLCLALILLGYLLSGALHPSSPYDNLRSFAEQESAGRVVRDITDLPVDELSLYAQATCARAPTADGVRAALRAQLRQVPASAREDIIAGAVVDGASTVSSVQNTTAGVERDGIAYHYISFWATEFRAREYATCVTTAGVRVAVGEEVAEWRTTKTQRAVGTRPCHCGYVTCAKCPVFVEDVARTPVFRRHKLKLQQQVDLHNWMVLQAVERAKSLASSQTKALPAWMRPGRWRGWEAGAPVLAAPALDSFLGEDGGGGVVTGEVAREDATANVEEKVEL